MIKVGLSVYKICHECPEFDPEYIRNKLWSEFDCVDQITVQCKKERLCRILREKIRTETNNGETKRKKR